MSESFLLLLFNNYTHKLIIYLLKLYKTCKLLQTQCTLLHHLHMSKHVGVRNCSIKLSASLPLGYYLQSQSKFLQPVLTSKY